MPNPGSAPRVRFIDDEPGETTDATMDYDFEDEYDGITTVFPDYEETTTEYRYWQGTVHREL